MFNSFTYNQFQIIFLLETLEKFTILVHVL